MTFYFKSDKIPVMEKNDLLPEILNNQMSMSNIAARSAQGFLLNEKRLFIAGVSKINPHPKAALTIKDRTFRVTAQEYAEVAGIKDETSVYKDMQRASLKLMRQQLVQRIETPKGLRVKRFNWLSSVQYHEGEGYVQFTISDEIMPHLTHLLGKFTSYHLHQTTELRSVYSWRFLEFFTSYLAKDETKPFSKIITLEDLRHTFEIPPKYKWNDLKKRVIEPAVKELTTKDGWIIQWQPIKQGRSVHAVKFTFSKNPQTDLFGD